jgi:methylated-DNA-[protein]-cysteine S-methyltransferase
MMTYNYKMFDSPVGELKLVASEKGLVAILWENDDPKRVRVIPDVLDQKNEFLRQTERQLTEYFSRERRSFDLPLDFRGTSFQKEVWIALLGIPYGETRTYAEIARQIRRPKACRAVGAANGKNPISIIAACHRVIGSSGSLTGFAGGLKAKAFLLNLEALPIDKEFFQTVPA